MPARDLDFHSADDVVAEITRLRTEGYTQTGQWNLTQICEHLSETTRRGMDGFGKRLPWLFRKTIGPMLFNRVLKTRKFPAGVKTFDGLEPTASPERDDPAMIDACIAMTRRAADFPGPLPPHPLVDNLAVDRWHELLWIHAAHHLGYLVPKTPDADRA
jgi:hypothetical protein